MALHSIELFAGVGMLGEGVRAGLEHLGIEHRTVCFVEREAYAAAVLAARMQEGSLDAAPIWSDVVTFDAKAWRGKVDFVIAGFPCQDLSVAGKRAGLDGKRSGLFFEVTRIATDCGAWGLFLENVSGIASATATVMDEAEGELEERAAARVVGELADLGWDAEWLHLSAGEVGASHGRERWFCLAYRQSNGRDEGRTEPSREQGRSDTTECIGAMAHAGGGTVRRDRRTTSCAKVEDGRRSSDDSNGTQRLCWNMGDTERLLSEQHEGIRTRPRETIGARPPGEFTGHGLPLADPIGDIDRSEVGGPDHRQSEAVRSTDRIGGHSDPLADTSSPRHEGREQRGTLHSDRGGAEAYGPVSQLCGIFAPGPGDPGWATIIEQFPGLAPALESGFRGLVDGVATDMDDCRTQQLRCIGNGVVALCVGLAIIVLARRAGLT